MSKKKIIIGACIFAALLICVGLYLLVAGYIKPMADYKELTDRFDQYIVKSFENDKNMHGALQKARMEMSLSEYENLKKTLLDENWVLDNTSDCHGFIYLIEEDTPESKNEHLSYHSYKKDGFLGLLHNTTVVDMYTVFSGDRVIIQLGSSIDLNYRPGQETK